MHATSRTVHFAAVAIVLALLGACAATTPPSVVSDCADDLRASMGNAATQVANSELAEAYPRLAAVIRCPQFDQLDSEARHSVLALAGLVALDLDKATEGHTLLVRASAMPEADAEDWIGRMDAARRLGLRQDAIDSLTQIGRRWPERLEDLNFRIVYEIVGYARLLPASDPAMHGLLDSLFAAAWTLPDGIQPSFLWRDLAVIELDRQQYGRAQQVVGRVQSPHAVVSMRIDRRFDRLRENLPARFDVEAAVSSELALLDEIVRRSPRSLDAVVQLTYALLDARRYDDVLEISANIMRQIEGASGEDAPYGDLEKWIWILDNRARALVALQRWGEAEALLRTAARNSEDGSPNVSHVINLAWFYAEAGRGDEALATLQEVGPEMSPYGFMQMHGARHAAALQTGDGVIAEESFAYLRKNRDDSLETWQWTLVRANRLDEAAALLIERLHDPIRRGDALRELQCYANPPPASQRALWNARWDEIRRREDVVRAIDAVGRIESFPIAQAGD
jgi:tetratricopeptide (TPR) repeat protein